MEETSYSLIFRGVISDGQNAETVKKNIAEIFKVSNDKIERLFSGRPVVVKKNVKHDTALKYQSMFQKAGALCAIEPFTVTPDSKAAAKEEPSRTHLGQMVSGTKGRPTEPDFPILPELNVITPKRTKKELCFSPLQSPSISKTGNNLNFNRADMNPVPVEKVELVSVFAEEGKDELIYRIIFFLNDMKRPLLLNTDSIRFNQFPGVRHDITMKSLKNFILYLIHNNPAIIIDKHTEEFLFGNPQNLIVIEPLDFISALGKSIGK